MEVFKFGGASVKDAVRIKALANLLKISRPKELIVVISAMDKTTNALEEIVRKFYNKEDFEKELQIIKDFHFKIAEELFKTGHSVFDFINNIFAELNWTLEEDPHNSFDYYYDQIVSCGELLSTRMISAYLNEQGVMNHWLDVRDILKTDNTFRSATINWEETKKCFSKNATKDQPGFALTQGFIGSTSDNDTTTLGREGSDFTAAILAYVANATKVTIWKDVQGVLNADPKWFDDTILIKNMSYNDAIELAYYGANVIHPKTIKPLQNKNIPLFVRSFLEPNKEGTLIHEGDHRLDTPCFIFKIEQVLISISSKDLSFINEQHLGYIYDTCYKRRVKINAMHNSAISLSLCTDHDENSMVLIKNLSEKFNVKYNSGLELITVRHYNDRTLERVCTNKELLLEIKSRNTAQLVVKPLISN